MSYAYVLFAVGLRKGLLLLVFSALLSVLLAGMGEPASAQEKGWVLTQKSQTFGDQYLYVSPSGFKCWNPKAGIALITHAPSWDVTMFNDRTKVVFHTTFDQWKQQIAGRLQGSRAQSMANIPWYRGGATSIAGLRATQYKMQGGNTNLQRSSRTNKLSQVKAADYWVSDDIQVPPKIGEMLAHIYGLPPTTNVPLRLSYLTQEGANQVALETYRSQQCPIPVTYYAAPQGYKPVKSDVEVMADEETKQMIDDMAKDLGVTNSSGQQQRPITNDDLNKFLDAFKKR